MTVGEYLELSGGKVWCDEQGSGEPVVFIHGGAVDGRFFDPLLPHLTDRFRIIRVDLWGHGRSPDRDEPFTLDSFARDVAEVIERVAQGRAHVVGHSIGAVVALTLALARPDVVDRLVLASGGFDSSDEQLEDMDAAVAGTVQFLGSTYGEVSPDGEEHFAVVTRKDFELSNREPRLTEADLTAGVRARTLVLLADDDLGSVEHNLAMYRAIPDSELAIVPGTSHFFLQEKPALSAAILTQFLGEDPVPTVAPVRRVAPAQAAGAS
jgi:pimeloyl-ACP methyl ester carboxylesterase